MLSIIETLKEASSQWLRNLGFTAALVMITATPVAVLECVRKSQRDVLFQASTERMGAIITTLQIILVCSLVVKIVASSAQNAVILNLVGRPNLTPRDSLLLGLRNYFGPLLLLHFILGSIALALLVPMMLLGGKMGIMLVLVPLAFLFVRFTLGAPLVVLDHMDALTALGVSWRMTGGRRFLYVVGAYLCLGLILAPVGVVLQLLSAHSWVFVVLKAYITSLLATMNIFLTFCLHRRISAVNSPNG